MKICLAVNSSPWANLRGGGNIAVHHHATELVKLGHEVVVLYSRFPGERIEPRVNYRIEWVRHYDVATINLNIFSYARALKKLLRRERFDVVHGNAEESCLFDSILRPSGIPFVYTSHANIVPSNGILAGMTRPFQFLKKVNCYLQRHAAQTADCIITFSEFSRQLVAVGLGAGSGKKIVVVPPGIDSTWFEVEREPGKSRDLLFWGRMESQKGVDELLQAFKNVRCEIPESRLILIGEGNLETVYKRLADELGLLDGVEFAGWKNVSEIQQKTGVCGVGIFPSRIESFGLAIAEAAASTLPVISTRVGAIPEFIDEGVTGTLVDSGDSSALSQAILNVFRQPEKFEGMARRAREVLKDRFSWRKAAEQILRIYQNEIDSRRGSP